MSDVIDLLHPVPYVFVPLRGRIPRLGLALETTPVRVREVGADAMRPRLTSEAGVRTFSHEGATWGLMPFEGAPTRRAAVEACLPWAADAFWGTGDPHRLLLRSPLGAVPWPGSPPAVPAPADGGVGRILHDGREQARRDLPPWLEGNVRVSEGRWFLRLREPLACLNRDSVGMPASEYDPCDRSWNVYGVEADAWASGNPWGVASPSRVAAHWDFLRRHGVGDAHGMQAEPGLRDTAGTALRDGGARDDVLFFINAAPGKLLESAECLDKVHGRDGTPVPDGLEWTIASLAGLAMRGMLGGIGPEDAVDVAEAVVAHGDRLAGFWDLSRYRQDARVGCIVPYAREVVLPALEPEAQLSEEDAMAFGGMVP